METDYDINTDDFDSIDWEEYFELYSWVDLDEVESDES